MARRLIHKGQFVGEEEDLGGGQSGAVDEFFDEGEVRAPVRGQAGEHLQRKQMLGGRADDAGEGDALVEGD